MKVRRSTGVNGDKREDCIVLQLTRVVPPSFSVPLWERKSRRFLCLRANHMDYN